MNLKRLILSLGVVSLGVASAASSYQVTITHPTWAGATELKPGVYKLVVSGSNAVFTSGKTKVEAPVSVEKNDRKASSTEVQSSNSKISEIRLGGTTTKLIFNAATTGDTSAAH
ncbi:MAG: hypothetical protein M3O20_04930 [Acidobacteriota bacterium]|nr:hypothetical protein [Acidobacteriota bacterium]